MSSQRGFSIEGVGQGVGGSYLNDGGSRYGSNPPDDTLLRDTAKELEQLFDEFQSLRNSITQADSEDKTAISPAPAARATATASRAIVQSVSPQRAQRHMATLSAVSAGQQHAKRATASEYHNAALASVSPRAPDSSSALQALHLTKERADKLEEELYASQDKVSKLEESHAQMQASRAQDKERRRQAHAAHANNLAVARRYEQENTKKLTKQTPLLEVLSTLEADGESQQKEIVDMAKEIKTLRRVIKEKDKVIESTTEEVVELRRQPEDLPALHNDIKMLLHTIEGLQEENKTLVRIQHAKTQAIEELSHQLKAKEDDDDVIALHRNQIKALEAREKEFIGELNTLKLAEEKRTKQILKEGTEDLAVSAKEWVEERRVLKAHVKRLSEELANQERLAKAQSTRVMTLQDRVNHITDVLKDARSRRMPSSLLVQPPTLSSHPRVSGEELDAAEDAGHDLVPVEMYHFLEVEIQAVRAELREKGTVLAERDDMMEGLDRKIDVLTRTRAAENKRKDREMAALKSDLEEARVRCTRLEEDLRKKENELRAANLQTKAAKRKSTSN